MVTPPPVPACLHGWVHHALSAVRWPLLVVPARVQLVADWWRLRLLVRP